MTLMRIRARCSMEAQTLRAYSGQATLPPSGSFRGSASISVPHADGDLVSGSASPEPTANDWRQFDEQDASTRVSGRILDRTLASAEQQRAMRIFC